MKKHPQTPRGDPDCRGRLKAFALVTVLLAAVSVCVWLSIKPHIQEKRREEYTGALLDSIEHGGGILPVDSAITIAELDYYDEPYDSDGMITPTPLMETPASVSQPEEPEVITGIGVLTIEKINLKLPVSAGVSEAQLKISVGWVPQTAPIGETGNAVIAGHRSYRRGVMFNRLGEITIGDTITYQPKDGEEKTFVVYDILEIEPGDQSAFYQPADEKIITLFTCTPIRIATHRLLIRARLQTD